MFLKPTSSSTLPHFAHRKRDEKKKSFGSVPVFLRKAKLGRPEGSLICISSQQGKASRAVVFRGRGKDRQKRKKEQKSNKNSKNPPGMRGFSLAAEKRGASAECVGADLRQSRGRNVIVSLLAVDRSNASRSVLE
jgi:hypothetical protein